MAQQQIAASIFDLKLQARTVALVLLAGLVTVVTVCPNAKAQTFQVLHNFTGCADGYRPTGTLRLAFPRATHTRAEKRVILCTWWNPPVPCRGLTGEKSPYHLLAPGGTLFTLLPGFGSYPIPGMLTKATPSR